MTIILNIPALYAVNLTNNDSTATTTLVSSTLEVLPSYKGYLFFEIHTANEQGAGTDSNIYVNIIGTKTNLTRQPLRSIGPSINAFERNQVDICMLYTNVKFDQTDNIIQGIELINDGRWAGSSWKPNCIYLSGVNAAQTNDRWVISGNPVYISFLEPNKAVCYA